MEAGDARGAYITGDWDRTTIHHHYHHCTVIMSSPLRVSFVDERVTLESVSSVNQAGLSEWLVFFALEDEDNDESLEYRYDCEDSSFESEAEEEEVPDLWESDDESRSSDEGELDETDWTSVEEDDEPEVWEEDPAHCLEYLPFVFPIEF
ncbi:hypothetical protein CPB85DRAFT_1485407 [Mucidula mucida]|nr:hypothetical protein CPB85DRAFT_1485407 [Mucidula mucida]